MKHGRPKTPCGLCGRPAHFRNVNGSKAHKCPHGHWCLSGDRLQGHHANTPHCRECLNIDRAKTGAPPVVGRILGETEKA